MTITLWGRSTSSNVQKVRWALGELGLAYEHILVGGRYGGNATPDYLAMNPNGLVPTLRDGDLTVWESHAIVRYLAATYGAGSLWPVDSRQRAIVDQWTDWTATTFGPAWIRVFWQVVRTPREKQDAAAIAAAIVETEKCLRIMDARLATSAFLGGESLTYADVVAGVGMYRWTTMPIAREHFDNVSRWHADLQQRLAYRECVEVDYSELWARQAF